MFRRYVHSITAAFIVITLPASVSGVGVLSPAAAAAAVQQRPSGPPKPPRPPRPLVLSPEVMGAKAVVTAMIKAGRRKDASAYVECLTHDSAGTFSVVPLSVIALAVNMPHPEKKDKAAAAAAARADFEKLLDRHNIGDFIRKGRITRKVDRALSRHGRDILKDVYHFMKRLAMDGLIQADRKATFNVGLAKNADGYTYEVLNARRVLAFDPRSGVKSLEARFEQGRWRLQVSRDAKWDKAPNSVRLKSPTISL